LNPLHFLRKSRLDTFPSLDLASPQTKQTAKKEYEACFQNPNMSIIKINLLSSLGARQTQFVENADGKDSF